MQYASSKALCSLAALVLQSGDSSQWRCAVAEKLLKALLKSNSAYLQHLGEHSEPGWREWRKVQAL
jgi:hypothetical protein